MVDVSDIGAILRRLTRRGDDDYARFLRGEMPPQWNTFEPGVSDYYQLTNAMPWNRRTGAGEPPPPWARADEPRPDGYEVPAYEEPWGTGYTNVRRAYAERNNPLHGGPTEYEQGLIQQTEALNEYLRTQRFNYPTTTYRGMRTTQPRFNLDMQPGDWLEATMPASTSFSPRSALSFAGSGEHFPSSLWRIEGPPGVAGRPFPAISHETEFLYPAGSRFMMESPLRPVTVRHPEYPNPDRHRTGVLRALRQGEVPPGVRAGTISGGLGTLPLLMENE